MIFPSIIALNFIKAVSKHENILAKKESFFSNQKMEEISKNKWSYNSALNSKQECAVCCHWLPGTDSHLTIGGGVSGSLGRRSAWPWPMSAWVKLRMGPLTEIWSRLSCFAICRRPTPGSSFKIYITWWASESGSVTFKCRSVMIATDPGREWERLGLSPLLLLESRSNDFRRWETKLSHTPRSKEISAMGLPWWSSGQESMLPNTGAQGFWSLVRELDPAYCKPHMKQWRSSSAK